MKTLFKNKPLLLTILGLAIMAQSILWEYVRVRPDYRFVIEPWSQRGYDINQGWVIAIGAGLPSGGTMGPVKSHAVVLLCGETDFNRGEMDALAKRLKGDGNALVYRNFPGAHVMPPDKMLEEAVEAVYAEGKTLTPDQGGSASTRDFCDAVAARLRSN